MSIEEFIGHLERAAQRARNVTVGTLIDISLTPNGFKVCVRRDGYEICRVVNYVEVSNSKFPVLEEMIDTLELRLLGAGVA